MNDRDTPYEQRKEDRRRRKHKKNETEAEALSMKNVKLKKHNRKSFVQFNASIKISLLKNHHETFQTYFQSVVPRKNSTWKLLLEMSRSSQDFTFA